MTILLIIISAITIGIGSIYFLGNDNPIEQAAEEVIFLETGKRTDLSPESDEDGEVNNAIEEREKEHFNEYKERKKIWKVTKASRRYSNEYCLRKEKEEIG